MKLFKKHTPPEVIKDKVANRIAHGILRVQSGFANYLFSITKRWNQRNQWAFLILVILILGGLSILAIVVPYQLTKNQTYIFPIPFTPSKTIPLHQDEYTITENEFEKILEYKSAHPNLQVENPPLFDSLNLVEQIYYSQKTIK